MFNSEALEIAIGMIFLFLLIAVICTAIKEYLEVFLKWRAMDLERALRNMIDAPGTASSSTSTNGEEVTTLTTSELLRHPLIDSLYKGAYSATSVSGGDKSGKDLSMSERRNLPSYIPAAQFASAFLDLVARGPTEKGATEDRPLSVELLREKALALQPPHLSRVVLTAIDHSGGRLDELQKNIETWFNGTMDRASGWYKRRTQAVLFGLGLVVAVVLNIDSLYVLERLTADKTIREAVLRQASTAKDPTTAGSARQQIQDAKREIDNVGLPIGWKQVVDGGWFGWSPRQWCGPAERVMAKASEEQPPKSSTVGANQCTFDAAQYSFVRNAVGWIVTAFAVMLGAPFWFDVLNKFMVIRSTVKPHEKSPEEGSEDRANKQGKPGGSKGAQDSQQGTQPKPDGKAT